MRRQQRQQGKSNTNVRWIRIGITLVALLFIVIGGIFTIQGSLQGSTILTVLGVAIGLFQWLFPLSTEKEDQKHANVSSTHEISVPTNKEQQITAPPPQCIWNVPYQRNPFFTNRANVLTTIHNAFTTAKEGFTIPQALSGLGGIGKTQIAIEYAYRYRDEYQVILWVNADSQGTLISDCTIIADALGLPEKSEKDQQRIIGAVKQWLQQHEHWLLILDNANDFTVVAILPTAGKGHILLTTQAYAVGATAHKIDIEKLNPEEGARLLLRRTDQSCRTICLAVFPTQI
jgi:NB-ARC domain